MLQVFLSSDVCHDSEHKPESLVIRSHLPLLYWSGTVVIARLGTHTAGVFVTIYDVGRSVMIEASDFEDGPKLASSTIPLEIWTGGHSNLVHGLVEFITQTVTSNSGHVRWRVFHATTFHSLHSYRYVPIQLPQESLLRSSCPTTKTSFGRGLKIDYHPY